MNRRRMLKLLNEILEHQVKNRGTKSAFYCCYTYPTGTLPKWVAKAERMVKKLQDKP